MGLWVKLSLVHFLTSNASYRACSYCFLCETVAGSVIKHKLVGHITLGVALRNVLDALRKSVDSKVCSQIDLELYFSLDLNTVHFIISFLMIFCCTDVLVWS